MVSSFLRRFLRESISPEDEGIFIGVPIVTPPDARDRKAEAFIQPPGDVIRSPYLERGATRANLSPFVEHAPENFRSDALPPVFRQDREVVDVKLVEYAPEPAEPDDTPVRIFRHEQVRNARILHLGEIHLARPGVEEGRVFYGDQAAEILVRRDRFDNDRHARRL
jgi:hypothetical protein